MTKTVFRALGSKRFSAAPPRRTRPLMLSLGSFESMIAKLDAGRARLKASRRKRR
jgi:hypothetical protein